jgi:hypothetical protein
LKKGKRDVFTNFACSYAYQCQVSDLSVYVPPEGAHIILDEISVDCDNRDFKTTSKDFIKYIVQHGHYHHDITWLSQYFDGVDRKLRNLTVNLYKLAAPFANLHRFACKLFSRWNFVPPYFIMLRRYIPQVLYNERERMLKDGHYRPSLLLCLFHFRRWWRFALIPGKVLKEYDSWSDNLGRPALQKMPW